jgi:hypothetical protein
MRLKLLAIVALVAGPILCYTGYSKKQIHEKIVAEGVKVDGVITGGESTKRRRSGTTYKFDISFTTKEGRSMSSNLVVPKSFVDAHVTGDTITSDKVDVIYLPSDPSKCEVVGVESDHQAMLYGGALAGVVGMVGTGMMLRRKN